MILGPWSFQNVDMEKGFQENFMKTLWEKSKFISKWSLIIGLFVVTTNLAYALLFPTDVFGQLTVISIRLFFMALYTAMLMIDWSNTFKPKIAFLQIWMIRFCVLFAATVEAGIKQPDSKLKVQLLWHLYVGGFYFPTFIEYLCGALILAFLEFFRLILLGGPCPVDSSRSCTLYELMELLGHHTLYLVIAVWINFHIHTDRRREYMRQTREARKRSLTASAEAHVAAIHRPGHAAPANRNHCDDAVVASYSQGKSVSSTALVASAWGPASEEMAAVKGGAGTADLSNPRLRRRMLQEQSSFMDEEGGSSCAGGSGLWDDTAEAAALRRSWGLSALPREEAAALVLLSALVRGQSRPGPPKCPPPVLRRMAT